MFLNLVHLRELKCVLCGAVLASPGARSFIVAADGTPAPFSEEEPPETMTVEMRCPSGHVTVLHVPDDVSAEAALQTPDDAPIGADAVLQ